MRMVLLVALLSLAPILAGCFDDDNGRGGSASDDDGATGSGNLDLAFLPPVDLACPSEGIYPVLDNLGDCGAFGEPVLEVAGDGAIWASATCCIGRSPPIWVSRDAGLTYQLLPFADRTGVIRDGFGIEGDFAIDDAGNVYFFDISAASSWFSKYQADGTHVFTKADAFPPLVDRPWVRAGVEDEVWIFYNTGSATNLFHSTNGGLTWSVTPVGFSCPLMTFGQGPVRDRLFVAGCSGEPQLWISADGGATFGAPIVLPMPDIAEEYPNGTAVDAFMPPVADAAGNIYVAFSHASDPDTHHVGLYVDVVRPDGTVAGPFLVSADIPWNLMPWPAAGDAGQFAVAWYGADRTTDLADEATWRLFVAATANGADDNATFTLVQADPDPVLVNQTLGRSLGDFLQSDIGPDGRLHVIYARRGADGVLVNRVASTDGAWSFGPGVPYNGPLA